MVGCLLTVVRFCDTFSTPFWTERLFFSSFSITQLLYYNLNFTTSAFSHTLFLITFRYSNTDCIIGEWCSIPDRGRDFLFSSVSTQVLWTFRRYQMCILGSVPGDKEAVGCSWPLVCIYCPSSKGMKLHLHLHGALLNYVQKCLRLLVTHFTELDVISNTAVFWDVNRVVY